MSSIKLKLVISIIATQLVCGQMSAQTPAAGMQNQGPRVSAPSSNDAQLFTDDDVQLIRKDIRSQKKQIVAANMDLSAADAEKFWPVYDAYAADLSKIYDTKVTVIQDYLQNYQTMNGDQAEAYLQKRANIEQSIMQLRLKYLPQFRKVISGRQTAKFFQIDWRLGLMIDLQLAQMPIVDP
jgi:anionic cell wall polymer biosynthesis LytR-Cps2A-Psr (LCP) family protein